MDPILLAAFQAGSYPKQTHYLTSVAYRDYDRIRPGSEIEVEWVEKATGRVIKHTYRDDVANLISRTVGAVSQRQMKWATEPQEAKIWLR